jgi:hypothetical protein
MSFLIDPPWLYATGRVYRSLLSERKADSGTVPEAALGVATATVFLGVSISLYQDRGWTRPIWRACKAESGLDWMLNSGVFRFDWRKVSKRTDRVSTAIFVTYPLWLWLGMRRR